MTQKAATGFSAQPEVSKSPHGRPHAAGKTPSTHPRSVGRGVDTMVGTGVDVGAIDVGKTVGHEVGSCVGPAGSTATSAQFQNSSPNCPFPLGPHTVFSQVAQSCIANITH